jgi:hypothetical protein
MHGAVSLTSDRQTADLLRAAIGNLDQSVSRVRSLAFDKEYFPCPHRMDVPNIQAPLQVVDGIGDVVTLPV